MKNHNKESGMAISSYNTFTECDQNNSFLCTSVQQMLDDYKSVEKYNLHSGISIHEKKKKHKHKKEPYMGICDKSIQHNQDNSFMYIPVQQMNDDYGSAENYIHSGISIHKRKKKDKLKNVSDIAISSYKPIESNCDNLFLLTQMQQTVNDECESAENCNIFSDISIHKRKIKKHKHKNQESDIAVTSCDRPIESNCSNSFLCTPVQQRVDDYEAAENSNLHSGISVHGRKKKHKHKKNESDIDPTCCDESIESKKAKSFMYTPVQQIVDDYEAAENSNLHSGISVHGRKKKHKHKKNESDIGPTCCDESIESNKAKSFMYTPVQQTVDDYEAAENSNFHSGISVHGRKKKHKHKKNESDIDPTCCDESIESNKPKSFMYTPVQQMVDDYEAAENSNLHSGISVHGRKKKHKHKKNESDIDPTCCDESIESNKAKSFMYTPVQQMVDDYEAAENSNLHSGIYDHGRKKKHKHKKNKSDIGLTCCDESIESNKAKSFMYTPVQMVDDYEAAENSNLNSGISTTEKKKKHIHKQDSNIDITCDKSIESNQDSSFMYTVVQQRVDHDFESAENCNFHSDISIHKRKKKKKKDSDIAIKSSKPIKSNHDYSFLHTPVQETDVDYELAANCDIDSGIFIHKRKKKHKHKKRKLDIGITYDKSIESNQDNSLYTPVQQKIDDYESVNNSDRHFGISINGRRNKNQREEVDRSSCDNKCVESDHNNSFSSTLVQKMVDHEDESAENSKSGIFIHKRIKKNKHKKGLYIDDTNFSESIENNHDNEFLYTPRNFDSLSNETERKRNDLHTFFSAEKCDKLALIPNSVSDTSSQQMSRNSLAYLSNSSLNNKYFLEKPVSYFNEDPVNFEIPFLHASESVSTISLSQKQELISQGITIKQGKFSPSEDEIIWRNYQEFAKRYSVSDPYELLGIGRHKKDDEILKFIRAKHFYVQLGRGLSDRTLQSIYKRARLIFDDRRNSECTMDDVKCLKLLHCTLGNKWEKIGTTLGKNADNCLQISRWHKKDLNKGKWTIEEEENLIKAIKKTTEKNHGSSDMPNNISWDEVAVYVGTRNSSQCRWHWAHNFAWKPNSAKQKWSKSCNIKLITILKRDWNIDDPNKIDWKKVYQSFIDVIPSYEYLRKKWLRLKYKIPNYQNMDYKDVIKQLCIMYNIKL